MLKTRLAGRLSLSRAEFRTKSDPRLAQMVHFSALCVGVDPDSSFKNVIFQGHLHKVCLRTFYQTCVCSRV